VKDNDNKHKEYLICGLGNPLLTDDAIGLLLVQKLLKRSDKKIRDKVDFKESHTGFMDLIDDFAGYKHVLIIDSIETLAEKPGTLILCETGDFHDLSYRSYTSIHGLNFPTIIELNRILGQPVPETCTIAGITVADCKNFGVKISKGLKQKVPELVNSLIRFIDTWITPQQEEFVHQYIKTRLNTHRKL
jgi:hydrogenase maturation protease